MATKTTYNTELDIWKTIEQLPKDQKIAVAKKILREEQGLILDFIGNGNGSNNIIQNSIVIQTSSESEKFSEQLLKKIDKVSPEILDELLIAIAKKIKDNSEQKLDKSKEVER